MKKCTLYDYRVEDLSLSTIEEKLEAYKSRDLRPLELSNSGWSEMDTGTRYVSSEDIICLRYTINQKILPASAVFSEMQKCLNKFEVDTGRSPAKHERAELKENTINKLMEHALSSTKSVKVLILQNTNQVLMESTSNNQCDEIMVLLLKSLGMQITIPEQQTSLSLLMTRMVIEDKNLVGVEEFSVLDSGILTHDKQKVTFKNQTMQQENVVKMINDGYRVTQLAIGTETVIFTLVDDFTLKGIKYDVEFGDCFAADLLIMRDAIMEVYNLLTKALEGNT